MADVYKDADWLRRKYWDEDMTMAEMADEAECNSGTICYWMDKHDIDTYNQGRNKRTPGMNLRINGNGYLEWWNHVYEGSEVVRRETFRVHRLVAIAEFGIDAVKGKVVHHENGVKWDNRPDNLGLMEHGSHSTHHNEERVEAGTHNFIR